MTIAQPTYPITTAGLVSHVGAYTDVAQVFNVMKSPYNAAGDWNGSSGTDDLIAINAAIADANTAGQGVVFCPGRHRVTGALTQLADGVSLAGVGRGVSEIKLTTDIGSYLIQTSVGTVGRCEIRDIMVNGPGSTGSTGAGDLGVLGGTTTTTAKGFLLRDRAAAIRVASNGGFYAGCGWIGNHQLFQDLRITGCGFAVYGEGGGSTFGDQTFRDCDFTGLRVACIGIAGSNILSAATMDSVHLGFAPYGIYGEAKTSQNLISDLVAHDLAFESMGNGMIFDSTGAITRQVNNCEFSISGSGWTWDAARKIAANAADYNIVAATFAHITMRGQWSLGTATLGAVGVVKANMANVKWYDAGSLINALQSASKNFAPAANTAQGVYFWGDWSERMRLSKWGGGFAAVQGDLATFGTSLGQMGATRGTTQAPIGVVAAAGANNTWVPVIIEGRASVNSGANTIAQGNLVKQGGTGGQAAAASSSPVPAATDHLIVGIAIAANSGGFTEILVRLGG